MGKMNEAFLKANEQEHNLPAVAEEAGLPAQPGSEAAAFMRAVASGSRVSFLGTLLLFKKGVWQAGESKEELAEGTRAVALMNEARHGWVFWRDKKPIYQPNKIGKLCNGFELPDRDTIGHLDKSTWPIDVDSGKRKDPWQHTIFLPMQLLDDEIFLDDEILTFTSSSEGGLSAFYYLSKRYAWLGRKHVGQYPVIELGVETYPHKKYGKIIKPKLENIGWTDRPDVALSDDLGDGGEITTELPPRRGDMDDEIPF